MTVKKKRKALLTVSAAAMAAVVGFSIFASSSGAIMTHAAASYSVAKNGGVYYSDYSSADEQIKAGEELVKEIAGEGMVLLKNDGTLPLDGVKNVSIFGKNSIDPSYSGGGSGGAKGSQEKIDIYKGLEAAGFNCNPALKEFYETESRSGISRQTLTDIFAGPVDIGETAVNLYDDALKSTFNSYNDCAFIVITRLGSEGSDNGTSLVMDHAGDASEKEDKAYHYNKLSKNETAMIKMVKEAGFKKIVAIINTPSAMELGDLEDDAQINGIVWAGQPGYKGFYSLGKILTGEINPSGHLADTFMRDITKDPTFKNFGDGSQNSEDGATKMNEMTDTSGKPIPVTESTGGNGGGTEGPGGGFSATINKAAATGGTNTDNFTMAMYEEGIYVGYKYYETKYQTVLEKSGKAAADAWYKDAVLYPFGYGLSYTSFQTTLVKATSLDKNGNEVTDGKLDAEGDIKFEVKVTNTGKVKGKDVLELYYEAPYIEGGVEKATKNLGAFAKTDELAPGESQTLTLTLKVQRMSSYDDEDKNGNNHKGYELDAGTYNFYISKDAHTLQDGMEKLSYVLDAAKTFDTDGYTNNEVKNRFEKGTTYASLPDDDSGIVFKPMTRAADSSGNRLITPEAPTAAERQDKTGDITERLRHVFYLYELEKDGTKDVRKRTKADIEAEFPNYTQATTTEGRTFTNKFQAMAGVEKNDPRWNTLLNELTYAELRDLVLDGSTGTGANSDLGKGATNDSDGPIGISQVMYPSAPEVAATWNTDLAGRQGRMVGDEGLWQNVQGWRGPGFNIHRSPFNGRNFEYYSEDGILTGYIGAEVVAGANSKGLVTWGKHLGLNEQETGRSGMMTFVSEQAMREIYFKGFQLVAELGHSDAFMTSMGRIGFVETYHNYAFNVELVKGEWGFDGTLITDALNGGTPVSAKANKQAMAVSGQDIIMDNLPSENQLVYWGEWDATKKVPVYTADDGTTYELWSALYWLRVSARNMLYTTTNSMSNKNGIDASNYAGETFSNCVGYNVSRSLNKDASLGKNVRFVLSAGSLPEGLSLSIDGNLTGTLTKAGNYNFTLTRYVNGWIKSTANYTYNVVDTLSYTGDAMDSMKVGTAFSGKITSALTTDDGFDSIGYQVAEDSQLPAGLTLGEDGTISGTPTTAGTYAVILEVVAKKTEMNSSNQPQVNTYTYPQEFTMVVADNEIVEPDPDPTPVTPSETKTSDYKGLAITGLVLGIAGAIMGLAAILLNLLKKKH